MSAFDRKDGLLRASVRAILGLASMSIVAMSAQAQDSQQSGSLEEVVVTGFRGSLEKALDDKRESAAAIDSIRAEDIAKFPDSNLAESVQRIPVYRSRVTLTKVVS